MDSENLLGKKETKNEFNAFFNNHFGAIYGLGAGSMFAITAVMAKKLDNEERSGQILAARYGVQLVLNGLLLMLNRNEIKFYRDELVYILIRVLTQCSAVLVLYFSFWYLQYTDATVMLYGLIAIFSVILARIWLKERVPCFNVLMIILILTGVVITAQPETVFGQVKASKYELLMGTKLVAFCALLHAISSCANRRIPNTPATVITFLMAITGFIMGLLEMAITETFWTFDYTNLQSIYFVLLGFTSMAGHYFWTRGLQESNVTDFILAIQMEIPFGVLFQIIIIQILPTYLSVIGAIMVITGVFLMAIRHRLMCCRSAESS